MILLAGLQGAGKTTAAAKLALYCQSRAEKSGAFEKVRVSKEYALWLSASRQGRVPPPGHSLDRSTCATQTPEPKKNRC